MPETAYKKAYRKWEINSDRFHQSTVSLNFYQYYF